MDNSNGSQELNQKLDMMGQAALQNRTNSMSAIMKLYTTTSLAEKQRIIELDEQKMQEMAQQQQAQQLQQQQQPGPRGQWLQLQVCLHHVLQPEEL